MLRAAALILALAATLSLSGCLEVATPEQAARMQAFGRALQGASPTMEPSVAYSPNPGAMGCYKTSEQVSGFNRLCSYNCMGSANVKVVGAAELCPLTMGQ